MTKKKQEYVVERSRPRVVRDCSGPSLTKQSFKDDCDINHIVNQFKKTGTVTHETRFQPTYGYAPAVEFRDALDMVASIKGSFQSLPADLRNRFGNDPASLLEFVENPENLQEARELGIFEPEGTEGTEAPSGAAEQPEAPEPGESEGGGEAPA